MKLAQALEIYLIASYAKKAVSRVVYYTSCGKAYVYREIICTIRLSLALQDSHTVLLSLHSDSLIHMDRQQFTEEHQRNLLDEVHRILSSNGCSYP